MKLIVAMRILENDRNGTIKPADKESSTVVCESLYYLT